jgi:nucleotidyltransferase substrate binding protein (TIGR01987 family)
MSLDLSSLREAVGSLKKALDVALSPTKMDKLDIDQKKTIRAGVIQNFEFTYELCWKFMRRWLNQNLSKGLVDGASRRELFRYAAEKLLISDVANWMDYHEARNETSHTYGELVAEKVFAVAQEFLADAQSLLNVLQKKND